MLISLLLATAELVSHAAPAAPAPKGHWSDPIAITGAIDAHEATGNMLVYLPAGYEDAGADAAMRYPLAIALHGWAHSPELFKKKGTLGKWADKYGIVLAVPAMGKSVYETAFYPETKGDWTPATGAPGTRWVAEVVLPYVRRHYRVYVDRAHTAVIGYSTGGRGAVLIAEAYPEFAFVGGLSGTYDLSLLAPKEGEYKIHALVYGARDAFPERWTLDNCVTPARLAKLAGTRLFIAHGAADKVVLSNQTDALAAALAGTKTKIDAESGAGKQGALLAHEFVSVPDAAHDWKFWNSQWGPMFERMAKVFAAAPAP
jgi:S-formylglutathione hydrolase FrmB